ncbi:uncharacterized protein CLUP02_16051 [Colletotrichum lupini]|uniref:Uncharacterized protein n=1 Tax=Colletotrichum lupini TaxID=145971 RepID=A0A9Q8T9I0_9PEZI|nr:uncharacterized protein CLUP02_16051 [Colletotrichum lupini]UQC90521.1 hypothetical protein CLUP02_16051 [Colletotrichum lupini]
MNQPSSQILRGGLLCLNSSPSIKGFDTATGKPFLIPAQRANLLKLYGHARAADTSGLQLTAIHRGSTARQSETPAQPHSLSISNAQARVLDIADGGRNVEAAPNATGTNNEFPRCIRETVSAERHAGVIAHVTSSGQDATYRVCTFWVGVWASILPLVYGYGYAHCPRPPLSRLKGAFEKGRTGSPSPARLLLSLTRPEGYAIEAPLAKDELLKNNGQGSGVSASTSLSLALIFNVAYRQLLKSTGPKWNNIPLRQRHREWGNSVKGTTLRKSKTDIVLILFHTASELQVIHEIQQLGSSPVFYLGRPPMTICEVQTHIGCSFSILTPPLVQAIPTSSDERGIQI